ncbi:MAG: winged helix-turn-helix domain-containing protein, partial [Nitrososphaerales archaeon]
KVSVGYFPSHVKEMAMKNRSRMEIIYDVISASKSPVKKTNLMYKSNLSFKQLELYLGFLIEQGLIEARPQEDVPGRTYGATSRGFQFMRVFEDLQGYLTMPSQLRNLIQSRTKTEPAKDEPLAAPEIRMT